VSVVTSRIGVSLGDPSGIGPEVAAAAITGLTSEQRRRLMVFCDLPILARAFAQLGHPVPPEPTVVDRGGLSPDQAVAGHPSEAGARAQVAYLEAAVGAARSGAIAGLVTAPIAKTQAARAGFAFPGHTEFLAARLGAAEHAMMFAGPRLKVTLATVHLPHAAVGPALDAGRIAAVVGLTADALVRDFGVAAPRIGVVGLNPHAGEAGMFGREELDVIAPAIEEARRRLSATAAIIGGPLVPDAAFRQAVDGRWDALVAMYHDQGLIPVKLIDFEDAVNVTLGLPIVRTSPDHGVAYDIAGQGVARANSFKAALDLCFHMVDLRTAPAGSPHPR
jgi:4-hydroxythreonine-4-phosphate dehydrogenase